MTELINALGDYIVVTIIGAVVAMGIVMNTVRHIVGGMSRERSRREIAAYIAEGSMTAEQGERLMKAGEPQDEKA